MLKKWGEVVLHKNGTVRLIVSDGLRNRLLRTAERVDKATLLYGAGGIYWELPRIGTALVLKRKSFWGYFLLALAALVALGGSHVRTVAKNAPRIFDTILDKEDVVAEISPEGGLTITLADKPWKGMTLRLEAGEFDIRQARTFITALRKEYYSALSGFSVPVTIIEYGRQTDENRLHPYHSCIRPFRLDGKHEKRCYWRLQHIYERTASPPQESRH